MIIELKKFGITLTSRQLGKEAYLAFAPTLQDVSGDEEIEVVFDEVSSLSPSWADEFLTPLREKFGERLFLRKSDNLSVIETISLLEDLGAIKYQVK